MPVSRQWPGSHAGGPTRPDRGSAAAGERGRPLRILRFAFLVAGLALFAHLLWSLDVAEAGRQVVALGWGLAAVLAVYFMAFLIDTVTWQLALKPVSGTPGWLYRLWRARMAGEAFNDTLPMAGFGGEPVKALFAIRDYGLPAHPVAASLILARTLNVLALLIFLTVGFVLLLRSPAMPESWKMLGGAGLGVLTLGVVLFVAVQQFQVTTATGDWLIRRHLLRGLEAGLRHVGEVESRLAAFYRQNKGRAIAAMACSFVNWSLQAVEVFILLALLGHPVSLGDAWVIESAVQLARAGAFLVPAALGV